MYTRNLARDESSLFTSLRYLLEERGWQLLVRKLRRFALLLLSSLTLSNTDKPVLIPEFLWRAEQYLKDRQLRSAEVVSAAREQLNSMESSRLVFPYNLDPPGDPWCRTMRCLQGSLEWRAPLHSQEMKLSSYSTVPSHLNPPKRSSNQGKAWNRVWSGIPRS